MASRFTLVVLLALLVALACLARRDDKIRPIKKNAGNVAEKQQTDQDILLDGKRYMDSIQSKRGTDSIAGDLFKWPEGKRSVDKITKELRKPTKARRFLRAKRYTDRPDSYRSPNKRPLDPDNYRHCWDLGTCPEYSPLG